MATLYVRTNGNDTTGDGSSLTPWLTITKGLSVATGGDTLLIGTGTYPENSAAAGHLIVSKNLVSLLTVGSETGVAADVIITGTNGVNNVIINGTTVNVKFQNLTIYSRSGSSYGLRFNAACSSLEFSNCIFDSTGNASALAGIIHVSATAVCVATFTSCTVGTSPSGSYVGVNLSPTSTGSAALTFTTCTLTNNLFNGTGASATLTGCALATSVTAGALRTVSSGAITVTGGTITGTGVQAINANGSSAITVEGVTISNTGAASVVVFGVDGTAGNTTSGSIRNCTISRSTASVGHGLLLGAGCSGFTAKNITIAASYDYAIVIKENSGSVITGCTVRGGSAVVGAALYFKAATNAIATSNTLRTGPIPATFAVRLQAGDTGNKSGNVTLTDNLIIVTATGRSCLEWGDSTADSGGGICDYNSYVPDGGSFGTVRGIVSMSSLTALQAAWSGYDVANNDTHSISITDPTPTIPATPFVIGS